MTPHEALLLRIQVLEGHARMHEETRGLATDESSAMSEIELAMLSVGDLFTWRDDLLTAAITASSALPSPVTFTPDLMPTPRGVYFFDTPRAFKGVSDPLHGIAWSPADDERLSAVFAYAAPTPTRQVRGPLRTAGHFVLLNGSDVSTMGEPLDHRTIQRPEEFDSNIGGTAICSFLIASWLWLKQQIMLPESAPVSAKVRRQADRAKVNSGVQIVVLRRGQPRTDDQADGQDVEWGCQWLVRGHWRQQFYPSTKAHRPLWIEPHVKGPRDKPLKPPSDTVFTVQR